MSLEQTEGMDWVLSKCLKDKCLTVYRYKALFRNYRSASLKYNFF